MFPAGSKLRTLPYAGDSARPGQASIRRGFRSYEHIIVRLSSRMSLLIVLLQCADQGSLFKLKGSGNGKRKQERRNNNDTPRTFASRSRGIRQLQLAMSIVGSSLPSSGSSHSTPSASNFIKKQTPAMSKPRTLFKQSKGKKSKVPVSTSLNLTSTIS
jgi:hypothetical protein